MQQNSLNLTLSVIFTLYKMKPIPLLALLKTHQTCSMSQFWQQKPNSLQLQETQRSIPGFSPSPWFYATQVCKRRECLTSNVTEHAAWRHTVFSWLNAIMFITIAMWWLFKHNHCFTLEVIFILITSKFIVTQTKYSSYSRCAHKLIKQGNMMSTSSYKVTIFYPHISFLLCNTFKETIFLNKYQYTIFKY